MDSALAFGKRDGICTGRYPKTAKGNPCSSSSCTVDHPHDGVVGLKHVVTNSELTLKPFSSRPSVSVATDANQSSFKLYKQERSQ